MEDGVAWYLDKYYSFRFYTLKNNMIYIREGQESIFHKFEEIAIHIIAKYNRKLLISIRPHAEGFIENSIDQPYEVH